MTNHRVKIYHHNDVYLKIESDELHLLYELSDHFTFEIPNMRFHPKVKAKIWDGKIRLFNIHSKLIYTGLLPHIIEYFVSRDIEIYVDPNLKPKNFPLSKDDCKAYLDSLNLAYKKEKIKAYDHQIEGFYQAINKSRCLLLSPTGSGKSCIIYSLIRFYLENIEGKILLIVPTINLVTQMQSDFKEYSYFNKWDCDNNVHCIYGGQEKQPPIKTVQIELENGIVLHLDGNENMKLLNNSYKIASELTLEDELDETWAQRFYPK